MHTRVASKSEKTCVVEQTRRSYTMRLETLGNDAVMCTKTEDATAAVMLERRRCRSLA